MKIIQLTISNRRHITTRSSNELRAELTAEIDSDVDDIEKCAEQLRTRVEAMLAQHEQMIRDVEAANRKMLETTTPNRNMRPGQAPSDTSEKLAEMYLLSLKKAGQGGRLGSSFPPPPPPGYRLVHSPSRNEYELELIPPDERKP